MNKSFGCRPEFLVLTWGWVSVKYTLEGESQILDNSFHLSLKSLCLGRHSDDDDDHDDDGEDNDYDDDEDDDDDDDDDT